MKINEAILEKEGVVLKQLIVGLVKVSSSALVYVATIATEDVVGLATSLWLLSGKSGGCSF